MVYITTPAIPSCFVAFFSDPYSHFKISNFNSSSEFYDSKTTALKTTSYQLDKKEFLKDDQDKLVAFPQKLSFVM